MNRKNILLNALFLLVIFTINPVGADILEITQHDPPPPPQIVLLYPNNLVNGSDFIPREYIYFTIAGNLSRLNMYEAGSFFITYQWEGGNRSSEIQFENGLGYIEPLNFPAPLLWNHWHTLTFEIWYYNGTVKTLETTQAFKFFANPELYSESLDLVPINYPNGSDVPIMGGFKFRNRLSFNASGFILENRTEDDLPYASQIEMLYRWATDPAGEWYAPDSLTYLYNVFHINVGDHMSSGLNDLYINISDTIDTKHIHYRYNLVNTPIPKDDWSIYDSYWMVGKNITIVNKANYEINITYNWHNGFGAGSVVIAADSNNTITMPDMGDEELGWRYLSFWVDNGTTVSGERRAVYFYDVINPFIQLIYPQPDFTMMGQIPLVWSLGTKSNGNWDYSQYKFEVSFDTDLVTDVMFLEDFNPIDREYSKTGEPVNRFFKSNFNYERTFSDRMVLSQRFDLQLALDPVGMGASALNFNDTTIRFKIRETTTNTVYNSTSLTIRESIKQNEPNEDGIQSASSDWVNIMAWYSAVSANGNGQSTTTSINHPPESSTKPSGVPAYTYFVVFFALIPLLSHRKKHT